MQQLLHMSPEASDWKKLVYLDMLQTSVTDMTATALKQCFV